MRTRGKTVVAAVLAAAVATGVGVVALASSNPAAERPTAYASAPAATADGSATTEPSDAATPSSTSLADQLPAASGGLTEAQQATLAEMAQEEKLAHDVYVALGQVFADPRFDNIAAAETRHLAAVRSMLTAYGVEDPTAGTADGEFSAVEWQTRYDELVARGSADLTAALAVGVDIERTDIADLTAAADAVAAADVQQVYARLLAGSQQHLRAFSR